MLSSLASNTIFAKARAMYGRRLTKQNFDDLLACQSVSEVAYYLKNNTDYDKVLAGINQADIHRGQLETKLKQKMFEDYAKLCRYELSIGENFSQYLIIKSEIDQILHSLLHINANIPQEDNFTLPPFLKKHTRVNLSTPEGIHSYEDLLNALSRTPYRAILEPFRPIEGIPVNYTEIENALYIYMYKVVFEIIDKHSSGETARQLREIFITNIDLHNYVCIARLKTFYKSGPDFIKKCLLPFGTLKGRRLEEMLNAKDMDELKKLMEQTMVGKRSLKIDHDFADQIPTRMNYLTCRHDIHFSIHPPVVMLSYLFIEQTELSDITNIIEGIRYKVAPSEIAKMLTIINFQ